MTHSVCPWNESICNWRVKLSLVQLMKSCNSVGPAALARVAIIHSGWKGWLHNCMCGTISLSRREEWGSGCFCCCPRMSRAWAWRQLAWYIPRPQTGPLLGVPDLIMYIVAQTSCLDRFRDENSSLRIHQRQAYEVSAYLDVRQMLVEPEWTGLLGSEVGVYLVSILDWHLLMCCIRPSTQLSLDTILNSRFLLYISNHKLV